MQCLREGVTLPNDDRPPAGLLAGAIGSQICPPDLTALQRRSSLLSAVSHSARPASVRVSSSEMTFDKRARSQRKGSGRRTTTIPTRSPGRKSRRRTGRSTPSLNSASITSMRATVTRSSEAENRTYSRAAFSSCFSLLASSSCSRRFFVIAMARWISSRASESRPIFISRSPRTLGKRW